MFGRMKKKVALVICFTLVLNIFGISLVSTNLVQASDLQQIQNVALNKTVTSSSDPWDTAKNLVDGNDTTRALFENGDVGHWWKIDLGGSYSLTGSEIMWEYPQEFGYIIEVSLDDENWTTVVNKSDNSNQDQVQVDEFIAENVRYVKITNTKLVNGAWGSAYEAKIFGYELEYNIINVALNKTVTSSSDPWDMAKDLVDGDDTTKAVFGNGDIGHWWKIDLGEIHSLTGSEIKWEYPQEYGYKLEVSLDDENWITVVDKSNNENQEQTQVDEFIAENIRYIKITSTKLVNGAWGSAYEARIFSGIWSPKASQDYSLLSNLEVSMGNLNPQFSSNINNYSINVQNSVYEIYLTATVYDFSKSTIKIKNEDSLNGEEYGPITLNVGDNVIDIVVTSVDTQETNTYTITVNRHSGLRDAKLWPFASDSIWNTPIGSDAVYIEANIEEAPSYTFDEDLFLYEVPIGTPWKPLLYPGWPTYANYNNSSLGYIQIADDTIFTQEMVSGATPNNCVTLLQPDGRSLTQLQPGARNEEAGYVWGYRSTEIDIYGDGLYGNHNGSGLSGLGAALKPGELTNDEPIRHALGLQLYGTKYYYFDHENRGNSGYRWPATRCDWYAGQDGHYQGPNPALLMGSLLAIPYDVNLEDLELETKAAEKMFFALQNFGGYIIDDAAYNNHQITGYYGIHEELEAAGYDISWGEDTPLLRDINKLFKSLSVVDNNSPESIGGGGTPRFELAPDFEYTPAIEPTPIDNSGWIASASTTYESYSAQNAIDGDYNTFWRSGKTVSSGDWFMVDLGKDTSFNRIIMDTDKNNRDDWPWDYKIEVSNDGEEWEWITSGSAAPFTQITFPQVTTRYIKITCTSNHPYRVNWWSIDEFNIYDIDTVKADVPPHPEKPVEPSIDGVNVALNKPAFESNVTGKEWLPASFGNDGDSDTRWCAEAGGLNHWWKVDLEDEYDIIGTITKWENAEIYQYKIEVSSDDENWTLAVDKTANALAKQIHLNEFQQENVRYVKITITGMDPSWLWASFYEMEVYGNQSPNLEPTIPVVVAPKVASVTPNGKNIPVDTSELIVTFDKEMATTVIGSAITIDNGALLSDAGTWSVDKKTITYTLSNLSYNTVYQLSMSGFTDTEGNMMNVDNTHSFTTISEPTTPTNPTNPTNPTTPTNPVNPPVITPVPVPEDIEPEPIKEKFKFREAEGEFTLTMSDIVSGKIEVNVDVPVDMILKYDNGQSAENEPLNLTMILNSEYLLEQVEEGNLNDIHMIVNIPDSISDNASIMMRYLLSKTFLQAINEKGINLTIDFCQEDKDDKKDKDIYTWIFKGYNMISSNKETLDVNLGLTLQDAEDTEWWKLMQGNNNDHDHSFIINFDHEGILPAQASIRIYVGDLEGIKPGDRIFLYHYNEYGNTLETLPYSSKYRVDSEGYITIKILHCSDYVICKKPVSGKVMSSLREQISITPEKETLYRDKAKENTVTIQLHLPLTLELVKNLEDKTYGSAVGYVVVSYLSSNDKVATVSEDGLVTAKGAGKAVITTVITLYSGKTKSFKTNIEVIDPIVINEYTSKMKVGETFTFKALVNGEAVEDLSWYTTEKSIIVIDKRTGKAKAKSAGTDYIVVKCGKLKTKIKVVVE